MTAIGESVAQVVGDGLADRLNLRDLFGGAAKKAKEGLVEWLAKDA
jgi:hypothetical protein